MNIIKLNAIESTNSYLKDLMQSSELEYYTVVVAENQTAGRGQMGAVWEVESGKSLTFSVFVRCAEFKIEEQFYFNMCIGLACFEVLRQCISSAVKVKWPNDIMAGKDKIAGILIENSIRGQHIMSSIVGIGVNVNQTRFPLHLEDVSSLAIIAGKEFDKEKLMIELLETIEKWLQKFETKEFQKIKEAYIKALFEYDKPRMFETEAGTIFMGKIVDVNSSGQLVVEDTNKKTREFGIKEIKFARY